MLRSLPNTEIPLLDVVARERRVSKTRYSLSRKKEKIPPPEYRVLPLRKGEISQASHAMIPGLPPFRKGVVFSCRRKQGGFGVKKTIVLSFGAKTYRFLAYPSLKEGLLPTSSVTSTQNRKPCRNKRRPRRGSREAYTRRRIGKRKRLRTRRSLFLLRPGPPYSDTSDSASIFRSSLNVTTEAFCDSSPSSNSVKSRYFSGSVTPSVA